MYFSLSLLRIKDLYMFRTLLAHPQETLVYWYIACVKWQLAVAWLQFHSQLTVYARIIPKAVCVAPPEVEQERL
jgi:hypothetical protein